MKEGKNDLLLDVLSADQFTPQILTNLITRAEQFQNPREIAREGDTLTRLYRGELSDDEVEKLIPRGPEALMQAGNNLAVANERFGAMLGGIAVYFWFEEPSTRTVGSFDAARSLLGLEKLGVTSAKEASSSAKGESFTDSMMTARAHLNLFGGGVVITRHPREGSAQEAADIHHFPVINAGDGQNEHPTQALVDIYTILRRQGRLENLHVVAGGDARYSRTVHSLARILALFRGNKITLVGDEGLWLEQDDINDLEARGIECEQTTNLKVLKDADTVYWTRFQKERQENPDEAAVTEAKYKKFWLGEKALSYIPNHASVMHPLPRGEEIPASFDNDPRAAYWDQVENSVPIRAALLEMILRYYFATGRYR